MLRLGYVAAIFAVAAVGYKLGKRLGNNINKIAIFGGAACFSYLLYKTLKRRRQ
jgi:hydrogenase/urease accessory protein HupE